MSTVKQVIIIRKDLNMRKGKMCAQASHASMAFLQKRLDIHYVATAPKNNVIYRGVPLKRLEEQWFVEGTTKIVCQVGSLEELLALIEKAKSAGIEAHIITDMGLTEFKEPTITCASLGPDLISILEPITGQLKLF